MTSQRERLYLTGNGVHMPAYWKPKLLYLNVVVSRKQLTFLSITISIILKWKILQKLGIDSGKSSYFLPLYRIPQVVDGPSITALVHNKFVNEIIKNLANNSEYKF